MKLCVWQCGLGLSGSVLGLVVGFYEHDIRSLSSVTGGDLLTSVASSGFSRMNVSHGNNLRILKHSVRNQIVSAHF